MKKNTNKLFFVNYEPRRMTVLTASMSPLADLAHRRLCDWTWIEGYPPPNDPAILAAIAKCSPRAWLNVSACLLNHGWKAKPKRFWHPEAMRVLRQARVAYECAHRGGVLSGKRRRELREARSGSGPKLAPVPPQMPEPVPVSVQCPPQGLAFADLAEAAKPPGADAEEASLPPRQGTSKGLPTPLEPGYEPPLN